MTVLTLIYMYNFIRTFKFMHYLSMRTVCTLAVFLPSATDTEDLMKLLKTHAYYCTTRVEPDCFF